MADDISVRIKLDGEKEFRSALSSINAGLKVNESELKLVAAQYGKTADSMEGLKAHSGALEGAIDSQKDKISALEQGLEMAVKKYGEGSTRALKLAEDLNNTKASLVNYTQALNGNNEKIKEAERAEKTHSEQVKELGDEYDKTGKKALSFADIVKASAVGNLIAAGLKKGIQALKDYAATGAESARDFETNQAKLTLVMQNMMGASSEQIDVIKNLIEQEEALGVVSRNSQTAAAQELATYTTKLQSLERLIPVMNNMIVQVNGVNASQEQAVTVATALGKTLDGQTGSLSRWGFHFTDAQKRILEGNNELRKLDVIAQVVDGSVGNMNYTLRQTTEEGRRFGEALKITPIKEEFGKNIESIKKDLEVGLLPSIANVVGRINEYIEKNGESLANLGMILATVINAVALVLQLIGALPPQLTMVIATVLLAVKAFSSVNSGLGAFAKANDFARSTLDPFTIKIMALIAALTVLLFLILAIKEGTDKAANSIKSMNVKPPDVPKINGYAAGTRSAKRGWSWVGEEGPELVQFNGGERVYTARESAQMAAGAGQGGASGSNYYINIQNIEELNQIVNWYQERERRSRAGGMN